MLKARYLKVSVASAIAPIASPPNAMQQQLFWCAQVVAHAAKVRPYKEVLMVCWSQEVMAQVAGKKCCAELSAHSEAARNVHLHISEQRVACYRILCRLKHEFASSNASNNIIGTQTLL